MIKRIVEKIQQLSKRCAPVNPRTFEDRLSLRVGWNPVKRGGVNFATHRLVPVDSSRMIFRPTLGAWLFYLIFLAVGIGLLGGVLWMAVTNRGGRLFPMPGLMLLGMGSVFGGIGGWMMRTGTRPIVFDRAKGFFWKGRTAPDEVFDRSRLHDHAELSRVHALQVISEYCSGNKSSYYSYELNLVLEDGERVNVIDHGNRAKLVADAKTLAAFLEKPLWDVTR